MERDINREKTESLLRRITEERERFVSAWQQGAEASELHLIRERIQELNDLLWDTALQPPTLPSSRTDNSPRGFQDIALRTIRP